MEATVISTHIEWIHSDPDYDQPIIRFKYEVNSNMYMCEDEPEKPGMFALWDLKSQFATSSSGFRRTV